MPLENLYKLIDEAATFWHTSNHGHGLKCLNCGTGFNGRPNRRYCSDWCKRQAEKVRERLHSAIGTLRRAPSALKEAEEADDYQEKRLWLARQERATAEFVELTDRRVILADSNVEDLIEEIRRKTGPAKAPLYGLISNTKQNRS